MESAEKKEIYEALLKKWQKSINLVSSKTMSEFSTRHFDDSAQLIDLIQNKKALIVDLGSGAGFPGMVLAMLGCSDIHLIESDQRKCAFLKEVSRETSTPVKIYIQRIEDAELRADFLIARALAPISEILEISNHLLAPQGQYILLKSHNVEEELTDSAKSWYFQSRILPSKTDERGRIVILSDIRKKS